MQDSTIYQSSPFDTNAILCALKRKINWTRYDLLIEAPNKSYNLKAHVDHKRLIGIGLLPGERSGLSGSKIGLTLNFSNNGGQEIVIPSGSAADTLFPSGIDERLFIEYGFMLNAKNEISLDFQSGPNENPFTISLYILTE